jgi:hypothetical protein
MFFRLTNSLATFQALINMIFADLVAAGRVAVYLDNILIYSSTEAEHCATPPPTKFFIDYAYTTSTYNPKNANLTEMRSNISASSSERGR